MHVEKNNLLMSVIGIGGMAAALTLGLRGHRVTVLEAAPKVCIQHWQMKF